MSSDVSSNRFSMRSIRSSLAASTNPRYGQRRSNADDIQTSFSLAPKRTLNIQDVKIRSGGINPRLRVRETNKERKRRRWREIQARKIKTPSDEVDPENWKYRADQVSWQYLPDLIIEHIFQYLSFREKLNAGSTCWFWSRLLRLSKIHSSLTVRGDSMCIWRYNLHSQEYLPVLDHMKVSNALNAIGHKLRSLSFLPTENLHNIVDFQVAIKRFCMINGIKLPNIEHFCYVFPCDFARKHNEIEVYGTGGQILQNMKDLLDCLPGLKHLELKDLQLQGSDAEHALDEVSSVCSHSIKTLKIVNLSRYPFSVLNIGSFINLRVLVLSPHNLGDDLVENMAHLKKLKNVHLVTNAYTEAVATPVDYRIWKQLRKQHPRLRVHLVTEGKHDRELVFQTRAPVRSIVYDTPYTKCTQESVNIVVDMYKTDIEVYCHKRLPRFTRSRSFHERADSCYMYLIRQCPYIHTLMIREGISTSTVLLLAYTGKNLRYLHVRKNGVILKCDWPRSPEWSDEFYTWLKRTSKSYDSTEKEVSQILGFRWYMLTDKQFKLTPVNLNYQHYYEGFQEAD